MEGRQIFLASQHAFSLLLSLYGLRCSFNAILRLHKYESTTKKLAEWSDDIAHQLYKTRTTQSTGAATTFISVLTSSALLAFSSRLPKWARFSASPAMLVLVLLARGYIKNFWAPNTDFTDPNGKKDVGKKAPPLPNLKDYNEAVEHTELLMKALEYMEYSWLISSLFVGMAGQSK